MVSSLDMFIPQWGEIRTTYKNKRFTIGTIDHNWGTEANQNQIYHIIEVWYLESYCSVCGMFFLSNDMRSVNCLDEIAVPGLSDLECLDNLQSKFSSRLVVNAWLSRSRTICYLEKVECVRKNHDSIERNVLVLFSTQVKYWG